MTQIPGPLQSLRRSYVYQQVLSLLAANAKSGSHFLGALSQIGADQGHQHRTEGKGPCPRLLGQIAQIAAGAIDEGGALQNCGKNHGGIFRTKRVDGLLPGTWADPEPGAHQGGGGHEIAPGVDPVGRMLGNVGASVEDHRQGEASLWPIFLQLWLDLLLGFMVRLGGRPCVSWKTKFRFRNWVLG